MMSSVLINELPCYFDRLSAVTLYASLSFFTHLYPLLRIFIPFITHSHSLPVFNFLYASLLAVLCVSLPFIAHSHYLRVFNRLPLRIFPGVAVRFADDVLDMYQMYNRTLIDWLILLLNRRSLCPCRRGFRKLHMFNFEEGKSLFFDTWQIMMDTHARALGTRL